jgi:head-tail adaptor
MKPSGERRRTIAIELHNGNTLPGGQPSYKVDADWIAYNGLGEVPASYQEVSGGETVRGLKVGDDVTAVITINATERTKGINSRMRVRMGARKLNIISALDIEGQNREIILTVKPSDF